MNKNTKPGQPILPTDKEIRDAIQRGISLKSLIPEAKRLALDSTETIEAIQRIQASIQSAIDWACENTPEQHQNIVVLALAFLRSALPPEN